MSSTSRISAYLQLMRFDKPIGTLLLLWPTLWALWIAAEGLPDLKLLAIFCFGTFVMRSAGCVVNDLADRNLDGAVARTRDRPLVSGIVSVREAIILFAVLMLCAFALVLVTNPLTIMLSFCAAALASLYPFMKRHTHLPQVVLGAAFSWSIPMAFAATSNTLPKELWWLYAGNLLWAVAYDTKYAMVDREDDIAIGIKSTAILFGRHDRLITGVLQTASLASLYMAGRAFHLGALYNLGLLIAAGFFVYHHYLIRNREPAECFRAFLHNNWVGAVIFLGTATHFAVSS